MLCCVFCKGYIYIHMLSSNSLQIYLRLLDAQVQPIVQYGSELWDLDKAAVYTENVHLFAETKVLGIDVL